LLNTLQHLLPQLDEQCEVLILDNASDTPVEDFLNENLPQKDAGPFAFRVIRNGANIGACANILRCIEMSTGEWTWTLGDDDVPFKDTIAKIMSQLKGFNGIFLSFSHRWAKVKDEMGNGREAFVMSSMMYNSIGFISNNIFRSTNFKKVLFYGMNSLQTMFPHIVIIFKALRPCDEWKLSSNEIVTLSFRVPSEKQWNYIKVMPRGFLILDLHFLRLTKKEKNRLQQKIYRDAGIQSFRQAWTQFFNVLSHTTRIPGEYESYKFYFSQWVQGSKGVGFHACCVRVFSHLLLWAFMWRKTSFFLLQALYFLKLRRFRASKMFCQEIDKQDC
jgi:glycosyltransferase involved in cell wall biosynthesis